MQQNKINKISYADERHIFRNVVTFAYVPLFLRKLS